VRFFLAALLLSAGAAAQPAPRALQVPARSGQQALAVEARGGSLWAGACAGGSCVTNLDLGVPEGFRQGLGEVKLEVVEIGRRRAVVKAVVPDQTRGLTWVALVAGPLKPGAPVVLFAGEADTTGAPTAPGKSLVQVIEEGGERFLVVGQRDGEVHLCGRPSVLGPRVVDPADLSLKPAKVQRLSREERSGARRLVAEALDAPAAPLARLLQAVGASSAVGPPGALTDGDPETSWSEGKSGEGRGEFVVFRAPREAPIRAIRFQVRPPTRDVPHGAAPRRFYLVDDQAAFEVLLPEDAWQKPGRRYQVTFPAPRATSCLGLALEDAYPSSDPSPAVTLAEVEGLSRLEGQVSLADLVTQLGKNGPEGKEAAALLVRGGGAAREAIAAGYERLEPAARFLALDAIDQGSCGESAPFFARLLASKLREEAVHARTRIERCGKEAAPALIEALGDARHPARLAAANELALLRPGEALPALLRADWGKQRKGFLGVLAKAAGAPRGRAALVELLDDGTLAAPVTLDLLRAAGDTAGEPEVRAAASRALARAAQGADFSGRYLALRPAARLAAAGDEGALGLLRAAAADGMVPLRAGAIEAAGAVAGLRAVVLAATRDPEPRVREAAARALAGQGGAGERQALLGLLGDEWTFVRAAAYDGLAAAGADGEVDARLLERLKQERSPGALVRAVEALGRRRAVGAAGALEALAREPARPLEARARATRALGALCHQGALGWLTEVARAGAAPMADEEAWTLGGAALVALGRLAPADLRERLAPMLGKEAPRQVKMAAEAALAEPERCR
jgi:hypothetical protein